MTKLFLLTSLFLAFFTGFSQVGEIPESMKASMMQGKIGPQEFEVLPPKSAIGAGMPMTGVPTASLPFIDGLGKKGAVALIIKHDMNKYCNEPGTKYPSSYTAWVMHLDTNSAYNSYVTSALDKKAMVRLNGKMDKYRPGPNYCDNGEMVIESSGQASIDATFKTYIHTTPRNFQVMTSPDMNSDFMKNAKKAREFYRNHLVGYLKYLKEYQSKPHIRRIGGNGVGANQPPPTTKQNAKAGTEDAGDEGEDSWKASRDGMGYAGKAVQALSQALDAGEVANAAAKLYGAGAKLTGKTAKATLGLVTAVANFAGMDVGSMAEDQIYNTVDMMVRATAKSMEQYGPEDPAARQVHQNAKIPVKNNKHYNEMIDAGKMLNELNHLFARLDDLDQEIEDLNLPKNVATGTIIGPGIYQRFAPLDYGGPIINVGNSTALQEQRQTFSKDMFEDMKNMGYDIPDEVLNMDVDGIMAGMQDKLDAAGVDMDLNEPVFRVAGSTTNKVNVNGQRVQNYFVFFAVSSPNKPIDNSWLNEGTIFNGAGGEVPNDDDKPKSKTLYVSTQGSDNASGTEEAPFKTLQKALNTAHMHRLAKKPVVIIVKDGTYREQAEVNWPGAETLPPLTITSQNLHGAIFTGSEPVSSNIEWVRNMNKEQGGWTATPPLHPDQWFYSPGGNPLDNPPPVITVNGNRLIHLPVLPPQANGLYKFGVGSVVVAPPEEVTDLNTAQVRVSTRKFALKIEGGGNITITNLNLTDYPIPSPNNSPGILHNGNVQVIGCKFE